MNYLLIGDHSNELSFHNLMKDLEKQNPGITPKVFDASLKEEGEFFSAISINSLFGSKEIIILKRAEKIDKIWNFFKALKNFNIINKDVVMIYTSSYNDFGKEVKPFPKKAHKEVEGSFKVIESFDKNGSTLKKYVMDTLGTSSRDAILFIEKVGSDHRKVKGEIEKIKLFLGDTPFSFEATENIITPTQEFKIFDLITKVLKGDKKEIFEFLNKTSDHPLFLALLSSELLVLFKLKLILEKASQGGYNNYNTFKGIYDKNKEIFATKTGFSHPYSLFTKVSLLPRFSLGKLEELLQEVVTIESAFKGGEGDLNLMLELFILKI